MSLEQNSIPEEYSEHISPTANWREIVAWVGDLPPLPHVAAQALSLIEDPDVTAKELSDLLGGDTALAARVLKIANSAMFSRQRKITTINQAVMIIGFKTLRGIIVAASLRQLNRSFGDVEKMIWENSACCAMCCKVIATKMRRSFGEEVFLIGLMHDLGKLVLCNRIPKEYQKIIETTQSGVDYVTAETELLGYAHPLIGALVAKKWNFSLDICQTILHHQDEVDAPFEDEAAEKVAVVKLGDLIAHTLGYGHREGYPDMQERAQKVLETLDVDISLDELVEETGKAFEDGGNNFM